MALTKADLACPERRAEVAAEIATALAPTSLAGAAIMAVSTVTGEGIVELKQHLLEASRTSGRRSAHRRFRLADDRSFNLVGAGTVVMGKGLSGEIRIGDRVVVSP